MKELNRQDAMIAKDRKEKISWRSFALFAPWRFIFLLVLILPGPLQALESPQFFSSVPDMPLMEGLEELTDQTVVFDKPEGRIIESVALIGPPAPEAVIRYYNDTLPQLGWIRIGDLSFRREGESLRMFIETNEGRKFLHVTIAPAGPSPN